MTEPRVEASRRELERRVSELRAGMEDAIGWAPRAAWSVPLVGLAAGFSLAMWLGRGRSAARRRRLAPRRPPSR